jgi:hypothetical protein
MSHTMMPRNEQQPARHGGDNLSRLKFCVDLKNRSRIASKTEHHRQANLSPALLILLIIMKGKDVKDAQTAKGRRRRRSMAI